MNCTVYSGIHTLSFSKPLTGEVYYRILHKAQKKGMQIETNTDYFDPSTTQTLLGYQKHGIVIYLSHPRPTIYKLKLRIEPERVLGNTDPQALWRCEKGDWKRLAKTVDELLGSLDIPALKEMKLSILELTVNLTFLQQEYVDLYIQILKKGISTVIISGFSLTNTPTRPKTYRRRISTPTRPSVNKRAFSPTIKRPNSS